MEQRKIVALAELEPYITKLHSELCEMSYSSSFLNRMQSIWKTLLAYATEHATELYNAEFRQKFTFDQFGHCLGDKLPSFVVSRALSMLSDFIEYEMVFRQKCNRGQDFSAEYKEIFESFLHYLKDVKRLSEGSLRAWRSRLFKLERFLLKTNVHQFCDLTLEVLNRYVETLAGYSSTTASETIRELRYLCDYAFRHGHHEKSFASALPHVKNTRQQRLPSVFTSEETEKLITSVDRNNPMGKRNYAILLIAAKMGLRFSDIRALEFNSFDWTLKKISIVQQKTRKFLELPLPDDVGWAVIDYLKNGRPETDCEKIFIQHRQPYCELGRYVDVVQQHMRKAGIKSPPNKQIGIHALRHGLASNMLENGVSIPIISSVLGHADLRSTEVYLRISLTQLQKCPLEVEL